MEPPKESQPALYLSLTSLPVRCYIIFTFMYIPSQNLFQYLLSLLPVRCYIIFTFMYISSQNLFQYLSQPWLLSCRQRRHIMHERQGVKIAMTIQQVFRFLFIFSSS